MRIRLSPSEPPISRTCHIALSLRSIGPESDISGGGDYDIERPDEVRPISIASDKSEYRDGAMIIGNAEIGGRREAVKAAVITIWRK